VKIFGPSTKNQCESVKQERMKKDLSIATAEAKAYFEQYGSFGPKTENPKYEIIAVNSPVSTHVSSGNSRSANSGKVGGAPNVNVSYPIRSYSGSSGSGSGGSNDVLAMAAVTLGVAIIGGIISSARKARIAEENAKIEAENQRINHNKAVTENTYKNVSSELLGYGGEKKNGGSVAMSGLGLVSNFEVKDENAPFKPFVYNIEDLLEIYYTKYIDSNDLNPMFEEFYSDKTGRDINLILQHIKLEDDDRLAIDEYNAFVTHSSKNLLNEVSKYKSQIIKDTLDYAVIANDVYKPGSIIGSCTDYKLITGPEEAGELSNVLSALDALNNLKDDFFAKMYYDAQKERYVISFRGSTSSVNDWEENVKYASGRESEQFSNAMVVGEIIKNLTPEIKNKIILTGHSQGGGQASLAGAISGVKTFTYNASGVWIEGEYENITAFYSKKDPLNELQDNSHIIVKAITYPVTKASLAIAELGYTAKAVEFGSFFMGTSVNKDGDRISDHLIEISKSLISATTHEEIPEAIGKRIEIDNTVGFKSNLPKIVPMNPLVHDIAAEGEKYLNFHSMNRIQDYFENNCSLNLKKWNSLNYIQLQISEKFSDTKKFTKQRRLIDPGLIKK